VSDRKSPLGEIGKVGLVLGLLGSEVTLSGATVVVAKLLGLPGADEVFPILDVLLTSLPLTLAAAALFVQYKESKMPVETRWTFPDAQTVWGGNRESPTLMNAAEVLGGCLIVSFLLSTIFDLGTNKVPFTFSALPIMAATYLYNYFTMFGPFPFVKSCVLGYFFARWYLQMASAARSLRTKEITIGGCSSPAELFSKMGWEVERIVVGPVICNVDSDEVPVEFKINDDSVTVEVSQFAAGHDELLPPLAVVATWCAKMAEKKKVDWVVRTRDDAEPGFMLRRILEKNGFLFKDAIGSRKQFVLHHEMA
jgi:hypothetical protein